MKIKEKYVEVSVESLDLLRKNVVLAGGGSVTSTNIVLDKGEVTVSEFKDDKDFNDNGFGDISF